MSSFISPGTMVTKKIRTEYMKRFRDPKWETFSKCYEDSVKYRLSRRLMEHAHRPWFWEGWDSGSDSSGWSTPRLGSNKIAPLSLPPPASSETNLRGSGPGPEGEEPEEVAVGDAGQAAGESTSHLLSESSNNVLFSICLSRGEQSGWSCSAAGSLSPIWWPGDGRRSRRDRVLRRRRRRVSRPAPAPANPADPAGSPQLCTQTPPSKEPASNQQQGGPADPETHWGQQDVPHVGRGTSRRLYFDLLCF